MKMTKLPESKLVKNQKLNLTKVIPDTKFTLCAQIRWDDECGNGHNTFLITGEVFERLDNSNKYKTIACGCWHEEFAKAFPEYAHLTKWHLMTSEGPMHYLDNTLYLVDEYPPKKGWLYEGERLLKSPKGSIKITETCIYYGDIDELRAAVKMNPELNLWVKINEGSGKNSDLEGARQIAIAPNATLEQLQNPQWLVERLPSLMEEFKRDIEALGFIY